MYKYRCSYILKKNFMNLTFLNRFWYRMLDLYSSGFVRLQSFRISLQVSTNINVYLFLESLVTFCVHENDEIVVFVVQV